MIRTLFFYSACGIAYITFAYLILELARAWNYSMSYESTVKETVCEMVKEDSLNVPCENLNK